MVKYEVPTKDPIVDHVFVKKKNVNDKINTIIRELKFCDFE